MTPLYKDATQPTELRVKDLMSRMTIRDKLAQMRMLYIHPDEKFQNDDGSLNEEFFRNNLHNCGALFNAVELSADQIGKIQQWFKDNSPLGIPLSIQTEGIHGAFPENCTTFPACVGMAASFDRDLFREATSLIGEQLHRTGADVVYAPNLDITRDLRWGRVEEQYGEDPYLISEFGAIYTQEVQKQNVASCIKHFAVHSAPESGLNLSPVHVGRREIEAMYLYAFRKVIQNAKPKCIMPAYSEIDGEPLHTSKRWLRRILREQLEFDGFTISDFGATGMVISMHNSAKDTVESAVRCLEAGVDLEAPITYAFGSDFEQAVLDGKVEESLIDEAVSRLLKHKFETGLFDRDLSAVEEVTADEAQKNADLARRVAENSVVLLKNENNLLPLKKDIGKVAVIGPNANRVVLGGYSGQTINRCHVNTLYNAIKERLGQERVLFAEGCKHTRKDPSDIPAAVEVAKQADVAVLVLGDWSLGGGGIAGELKDVRQPNTCGEGFDVNSLDLPGAQQELLEAVCATGTPVVLILESGRPYAVTWAKDNVPAILQAWYPGEQGGAALANLLFGDANPSAKLPVSFARSVGHLPCHYNRKPSAGGFYHTPGSPENPGRDYVFSDPSPLFTFGEGLSYTTFEYSDLKITPDANGEIPVTVEVTVKNTGDRAGGEAVLVFVSDVCASITPYVKQLKAFDKVYLQPGEAKTLSFTLDFDAFGMINEDYVPEAQAGEFLIQVGSQAASFILEKSILRPDLKLCFE